MSGASKTLATPLSLLTYVFIYQYPLLADSMVAFPTLDAMTFFVLPGSPDSDTYHTTTNCPMNTLQWCTGLIFDFSTARWTRAPVPQPNTAIQCYGLCHELGPTGTLCLKVDSTALNISTSGSAPSDDTSRSPDSTASAPVTPSKRRKFDPPFLPPSVDSPDSPLASSTSTPSSNVATSMASVADPNARIGPMHYSQLFQQYPQCMPPPTGVYVPPFHPQQDLTFQPPYTPYNSRGEYTLPSIDSRTPASTSHPDSADI
ncbi:hypothetical protein B0H13DRAFT_2348449 [Mycena leptocephala]|nr:hypothetical protein B0H13DRAFT_2348449 [Mycena leptocephala]